MKGMEKLAVSTTKRTHNTVFEDAISTFTQKINFSIDSNKGAVKGVIS